MAKPPPHPHLWIDVEHGATFGKASDSVEMFEHVIPKLGAIRDIWLFSRSGAARNRGFCYPRSAHVRFGVPLTEGPLMVLIDDTGDQIWLSGPSAQPGGIASAREIVERIGLTGDVVEGAGVVGRCDEIHIVDGDVVGVRSLDDPAPRTPPGETFVRGNRLVSRMEFDQGGVSAVDLRQLWAMATEPRAWLGKPISLLLYDSRLRSYDSGYDGCQLIATGETGRELWLQLPEADEYDRIAPGRQRDKYEGSFTEYESAKKWIFRGVDEDLPSSAERPLWHKLTGKHQQEPELVRWP